MPPPFIQTSIELGRVRQREIENAPRRESPVLSCKAPTYRYSSIVRGGMCDVTQKAGLGSFSNGPRARYQKNGKRVLLFCCV